MSGTVSGGKRAAATIKERDPDFYRRIGALGGSNGKTGGFATMTPCDCDLVEGEHHKAQCAGKRGGYISKRTKRGENSNETAR